MYKIVCLMMIADRIIVNVSYNYVHTYIYVGWFEACVEQQESEIQWSFHDPRGTEHIV